MTVSSFIDLKQKYKTGAFRWQVIELYRLGLVDKRQVLTELNLSSNFLRIWNRAYQRYRLRQYYPKSTYIRPIMTDAQQIAFLKQQLAQTEKLLQEEKLKREAFQTMITIAEKEFKIPIRKKSAGPPERFQTVDELSRQHPLVGMQTLCGLFGKSRQAWYEAQKQDDKEDLQAGLLISEVRRLRSALPCIGIDVLHFQLSDFRTQYGIKIGRDKLANLLRDSGLLILRKSKRIKTTYSHHRYFKYPNLITGKKIQAPNCLWVSDITFILIGRGFGYLSLITDGYSRKIVGWALDESLRATGPVAALKMALKANKGRLSNTLIHHGAGRPVRSGRSILLS